MGTNVFRIRIRQKGIKIENQNTKYARVGTQFKEYTVAKTNCCPVFPHLENAPRRLRLSNKAN
jgi:hypothetical protein